MTRKPKRVREQTVVYLDARDNALLETMAEKTGLAKTELFRRALRRFAALWREMSFPPAAPPVA